MNLVSNALKFTSKGKIEIFLYYDSYKHIFKTTVRDTGAGINVEDQDKLFTLFGKIEQN